MMMKPLVTLLLSVILTGSAFAQTTYFTNADGIAIRGYDPVAYFHENAPAKGSNEFSYSWQGAEWHFKSQSNLDTFKANPDKFAPQFGGYCAYGASENHKSPTEPAAFTIVDERLYLNYNLKVKGLWLKDVPGHIKKAETNWVTLKDKPE